MHNQLILNGIIAGSIYALIAIGYTMIYGIGKFINFAHGEVCLAGAFIYYTFHIQLGISALPSAIISIILVAIVGLLLERIAYRPFRDKSHFVPLINTIGVSIFLQSLYMMVFGVNAKSLNTSNEIAPGLAFAGAVITPIQIIILSTTLILMLFLMLFLKRSRMGKALRATSEDREIASVLGVNTNTTSAVTFAIGAGLAAVAGILIGYDQNITPSMGGVTGIKAFTAAVLGGIGSVPGAVVGGLSIGIIETYLSFYISNGYKEGVIFLILLLLLFFRPNGILGKKWSRF